MEIKRTSVPPDELRDEHIGSSFDSILVHMDFQQDDVAKDPRIYDVFSRGTRNTPKKLIKLKSDTLNATTVDKCPRVKPPM